MTEDQAIKVKQIIRSASPEMPKSTLNDVVEQIITIITD